MTIGEKIRKYRKEKGLTQKELGELCGLSETTIRKYELGIRNPKGYQLEKIAKSLGITPFEIMGVGFFDETIDVDYLSKTSKLFDAISSIYGINNRDVLESLDTFLSMEQDEQEKISSIFDEFIQLNQEGQEKVSSYISDIKDKYRKED